MIRDMLLDNSQVYNIWQRPFNRQKVYPLIEMSSHWEGRTVVDLGCGPGINAALFSDAREYFGYDLNPQFIESARKNFPTRTFHQQDVTQSIPNAPRADVVFASSLMHHLSDEQVHRFLGNLRSLCTAHTTIFLIDLLLPSNPYSLAYCLARLDRGYYPRAEEHWIRLASCHLEIETWSQFPVCQMGLVFWNLFFLKGKLLNA